MNPNTNNDTQPPSMPPVDPQQQQPAILASKRVIQPLSDNIVIEPAPVPIRHAPEPVVVPPQTELNSVNPSIAAHPQPNSAPYTGAPIQISQKNPQSNEMGALGIGVTAIGILYVIGGVLSVLSGLATLLTMNPSAIVTILLGALYVYIGSGLIKRNETARFWALVLAWIAVVASIGTLVLGILTFASFIKQFEAIVVYVLAVYILSISYQIACIVILTRSQVKRGFKYA
ncbi:MAG: hypothetical protein WBK76_05415 [Candidatus Saccharimonadales bacterium]